jgi:hypothetical protein
MTVVCWDIWYCDIKRGDGPGFLVKQNSGRSGDIYSMLAVNKGAFSGRGDGVVALTRHEEAILRAELIHRAMKATLTESRDGVVRTERSPVQISTRRPAILTEGFRGFSQSLPGKFRDSTLN